MNRQQRRARSAEELKALDAERVAYEALCRASGAAAVDPMEQAYWRLVPVIARAMIEGGNAELARGTDTALATVAMAYAAGAALMFAVSSVARPGADHVVAAEKLAPLVVDAMRKSTRILADIEGAGHG